VHQAHGDARPARIDAPPPFQGDGAGLDHVVRCRRLRAIGERRIRAGVVTIRLPQRGWRHHQAEGDRVGLAQREEERLDIAIARHRLGITEVGVHGHEADLPAEKRAASSALEVVLRSAPVRRRTSEEPRVIGSEQGLLKRAHVHLGLFGGQPIVEEGMDHRQQTLEPPGVPVPRMPPVRDATVGMHLGEPGQRLVDDQPPLNVRADLRRDALERRRVQERIGSVGEAVLHEILAELDKLTGRAG
jgi:hypothetical protein